METELAYAGGKCSGPTYGSPRKAFEHALYSQTVKCTRTGRYTSQCVVVCYCGCCEHHQIKPESSDSSTLGQPSIPNAYRTAHHSSGSNFLGCLMNFQHSAKLLRHTYATVYRERPLCRMARADDALAWACMRVPSQSSFFLISTLTSVNLLLRASLLPTQPVARLTESTRWQENTAFAPAVPMVKVNEDNDGNCWRTTEVEPWKVLSDSRSGLASRLEGGSNGA